MDSPSPTNPSPPPVPPEQPLAPLRSVYTAGLPELLSELGISLFVTTYQAGRLVILRAGQSGLNTHFRQFSKPMGLALHQNRLALGAGIAVHTFQDVPAVAPKLDSSGSHDTCFLPRATFHTGDILVHEMAWIPAPHRPSPLAPHSPSPPAPHRPSPLATHRPSPPANTAQRAAGATAADGLSGLPELWLVNTRFSCLCTLHTEYSFVPRWQPPFITSLAPEDRCHLNGLAVVDGQPRFVTALGEVDQAGGWRERKKDGGVLIDIPSGETILRGLSMPHSPRWYNSRLWVLNSGAGELCLVEPALGTLEPVVRMPGFTRGLDFYGRYAFIGLSQVRESAVFSGIPIADLPLEQRSCGVWVVDIVAGAIVGFVRFEDAVQEIFAVQVAPGRRFPDLIADDPALLSNSFVLPDSALQQVPENWRSPAKG